MIQRTGRNDLGTCSREHGVENVQKLWMGGSESGGKIWTGVLLAENFFRDVYVAMLCSREEFRRLCMSMFSANSVFCPIYPGLAKFRSVCLSLTLYLVWDGRSGLLLLVWDGRSGLLAMDMWTFLTKSVGQDTFLYI